MFRSHQAPKGANRRIGSIGSIQIHLTAEFVRYLGVLLQAEYAVLANPKLPAHRREQLEEWTKVLFDLLKDCRSCAGKGRTLVFWLDNTPRTGLLAAFCTYVNRRDLFLQLQTASGLWTGVQWESLPGVTK